MADFSGYNPFQNFAPSGNGGLGGSGFTSGSTTMMRDSRTASRTFGFDQQTYNLAPRHKFLFYARFIRPGDAGSQGTIQGGRLDWSRGLSFAIKQLDRPEIRFETQTLNQYNKKRVIQTKSELNPVTIRFHDTNDLRVYTMFEEYYRYYYPEAHKLDYQAWSYDVTNGQFKEDGGWGFGVSSVGPNQSYFFSHIEVYQLFSGYYSQFDLINPKITTFNPDALDYEAGSSVPEVIMQIAYEGIVFHRELLPISAEKAEMFGLNISDFYQPSDTQASSNSLYANQGNQIDPRYGLTGPGGVGGRYGSQGGRYGYGTTYGGANGSSGGPMGDALNSALRTGLAGVLQGNTKNLGANMARSALSQFGNFNFGGIPGQQIIQAGVNGAMNGNLGKSMTSVMGAVAQNEIMGVATGSRTLPDVGGMVFGNGGQSNTTQLSNGQTITWNQPSSSQGVPMAGNYPNYSSNTTQLSNGQTITWNQPQSSPTMNNLAAENNLSPAEIQLRQDAAYFSQPPRSLSQPQEPTGSPFLRGVGDFFGF